jgi:hypothetical protein
VSVWGQGEQDDDFISDSPLLPVCPSPPRSSRWQSYSGYSFRRRTISFKIWIWESSDLGYRTHWQLRMRFGVKIGEIS